MSDAPRAVIFDLDGTLVNSRTSHLTAFRETLQVCDEELDLSPCLAKRTEDALRDLLPDATHEEILSMAKAKRTRATELMRAQADFLIDGAVEVVQELSRSFRIAVCSSGSQRTFEIAVERGLDRNLFEVVVTAEDCLASKPSPDPYLLALRRLGSCGSNALAVEDTVEGVQSATAAGLRVLLVGRVDAVPSNRETVSLVGSLRDVPELVRRIHPARRS